MITVVNHNDFTWFAIFPLDTIRAICSGFHQLSVLNAEGVEAKVSWVICQLFNAVENNPLPRWRFVSKSLLERFG